MFKDVDTTKEYEGSVAIDSLREGKVITSKKTLGNYKIYKSEGKEILKFQHSTNSIWQDAEYILFKEIIGKWYITD